MFHFNPLLTHLRELSSIAIVILFSIPSTFSQVNPALPHTHAHNDYTHPNPLWNALSYGFTEVEIDVFPIEGELYVSHDPPTDLTQTPTLAKLYIDPLVKWIAEKGRVYPTDSTQLWLMIDIKREGAQAVGLLKEMLQQYPEVFQHRTERGAFWAPVRIFISGDRPFEQILADSLCWMGLDGRPDDLGKGYDAQYMPVISQHYRRVMKWRGEGKIPQEDFKTLQELARKAHSEGKKVRLWATPESPQLWETLLAAGIDLLNTDELERLALFLRSRDKQ